jgi:hypothetical protein
MKIGIPTRARAAAAPKQRAHSFAKKTGSETLTRPRQAEFLRETFPTYSLTTRQIEEIFRAV